MLLRAMAVLALVLVCACVTRAQTPHWSADMRNPDIPVDSVQAIFNAAWDGETTERGKGPGPPTVALFAQPRAL